MANEFHLPPHFSYFSSSETESDDEEHVTELTRRMYSTLELDLNDNNNNHNFTSHNFKNPKAVFFSGSPQSTLCAMESNGKGASPNGGVLNQANSSEATWDLLRAAAGEVERMRINEQEAAAAAAYGVPRHTGKPSPVGLGCFSQQHQLLAHQQRLLSQQQLQLQMQIAQFEMMRRQQVVMQQECYENWQREREREMVQSRGRNENDVVLSGTAWPSLQEAKEQQLPQYRCDRRAVFLGKKERKGTGVFFPSISTTAEARKKLVGSTALDGGYKQQKNRGNGNSNMENASGGRGNNGISHQWRTVRMQTPVNHEIRLPREWTY